MRAYIYTPLADISAKDPGQWCVYDMSVIQNEWTFLINRHRKFIEQYFPQEAEAYCEIPMILLSNPDGVNGMLMNERRSSFGTVYNRTYVIVTEQVPKTPVWIPNAAGEAQVRSDIRQLFTMTLERRIFMLFLNKFPRFLQMAAPKMPTERDLRPHLNNEPKSEPTKVRLMQIAKAYPVPFTTDTFNEMIRTIDSIAGDFAKQNCGQEISIKDRINQIINEGARVIVPQEDIKTEMSFPPSIAVSLRNEVAMIPTQTKYALDIYREDKLLKRKKGNMIPFSFMEMWYKIFEQIYEDPCKNWTFVWIHANAPASQTEESTPTE